MTPQTLRRLRVLQSFPPGGSRTNPYLLQLVEALRETDPPVDVSLFTWRAALLGRYDVLHVHWPERLARGNTAWRTWSKRLRFVLLLLRLRLRRTPVVRTLHNLESHEQGSATERGLLRALDRLTVVSIRLNPFTPIPPQTVGHLIPHGDYRAWVPASAATPVAGRLLFFGLIRPYKGIEELVAAIDATGQAEVSLLIAGPPADEPLTARLQEKARADDRVTVEAQYLPDSELADRIGAAEVVVLPYRTVHNSGAALLALSLNRPVLMPRTETTEWLQQEVGPQWLLTYEPPLDAEDLLAALGAARSRDDDAPVFQARDWPSGAAGHVIAYRDALSRAGKS